MDTKQQVLLSLKPLIAEQLGVPQDAITPASTWMQLGADSLDRLAVSIAIEERFRVEIPYCVGERLNTVGDTLDHLCGLLAPSDEPFDPALRREASALAIAAPIRSKASSEPVDLSSKQQLIQCLAQVIGTQIDIRPELVTSSATWMQLGADSLDRLAISLAIEEALPVNIPHEIGQQLNTVGDTVEHVWGLVSAAN